MERSPAALHVAASAGACPAPHQNAITSSGAKAPVAISLTLLLLQERWRLRSWTLEAAWRMRCARAGAVRGIWGAWHARLAARRSSWQRA